MMVPLNLDKFKSKPAGHVIRDGKRIALETLEPKAPAQKKRKPFKPVAIIMPIAWAQRLRQTRQPNTHNLAHWILEEAFKRKHLGGNIVLSSKATGMARPTRWRAISELIALELIKVAQQGHEAPRITKLLNLPPKWNHAPATVL
jgi:hypothetical protein